MRFKYLLALVSMLALVWLAGDDAYGQRGGRGGGGGGRGGGGGARVSGGARVGGTAVGPYGGAGGGSRSTGTVVGPAGGSRTVGGGSGSYTTNRGTTINAAGAGRSATGPGGASARRGVGGVQVTTPGGQTATKVGTAGGVRGPAGNAPRSAAARSAVPPGRMAAEYQPLAARGPSVRAEWRRVGRASAPPLDRADGRSACALAYGGAANPYAGYTSGARGVTVGGYAGHFTTYRGAAAVRTQAGYVRTGFTGYNYFNAGWYTAHPVAWRAAAWTTAAAYWTWAPYATVATFCGYPAEPIVYDYGSTVVYLDNRVFYNAELVATAEEYAGQALDIAAAGEAAKPSDKDEWQSLGVFAMVQGEEKDANNIFQLAINKDGVLRGNYYNALTDTTVPISGSVDKRTQRAAWTVGDKKETVYETGFANLSQAETQMLVHFGKERTQQWTLVRLEPLKEMK